MTMFFDPFQEVDRITGALLRNASTALMPTDLYREGDQFVLTADLPGVDPGSINVSVDGQTLTLSAERTLHVSDGAEWLTRERPDASFVRQFTLGNGIDADHINANYENGVLRVVIPVQQQATRRKVEVMSGSPAQRSVEGGRAGSAENQAQPVEERAGA